MYASMQPCPGCSALYPEFDGPAHPYIGCSPGCWQAYGHVLAREFCDRAYFAVHRLTVDTFAAQHPGNPSPQSIQSVATHLIALHLTLEKGMALDQVGKAIALMSERKDFIWLDPTPASYALTVLEVDGARSANDHCRRVRNWAQAVWQGWRPHHNRIRGWAALVKAC